MTQPIDFNTDQSEPFARAFAPDEKRDDSYIPLFETKEQLEAEMSRMLEQYDEEKLMGIFYWKKPCPGLCETQRQAGKRGRTKNPL